MPDQVTIIIICLLYTVFSHYSDFKNCFGLLSRKIAGMCLTLQFVFHVTSSCFSSLVPYLKLTFVILPIKQMTNVSLLLKHVYMNIMFN